jgi:hypothetical protein
MTYVQMTRTHTHIHAQREKEREKERKIDTRAHIHTSCEADDHSHPGHFSCLSTCSPSGDPPRLSSNALRSGPGMATYLARNATKPRAATCVVTITLPLPSRPPFDFPALPLSSSPPPVLLFSTLASSVHMAFLERVGRSPHATSSRPPPPAASITAKPQRTPRARRASVRSAGLRAESLAK